MLIILQGPPGTGKTEVARYLNEKLGFKLLLLLPSDTSAPAQDEEDSSKDLDSADQSSVRRFGSRTVRRHRYVLAESDAPIASHASASSSAQVIESSSSLFGKVLTFPHSKQMLDYVTDRWQDRFVTMDLVNKKDLEAFTKRPFVLVVSIQAPLLVRFKRFQHKYATQGEAQWSLEDFAQLDDQVCFGPSDRQQHLSTTTGPAVLDSASMTTMVDETSAHALRNLSIAGSTSLPAPTTTTVAMTRSSSSNTISDTICASSSASAPLTTITKYVNLQIINEFPTLSSLHTHLASLNLISEERLRPGWDHYFLSLCNLASLRSNCMKRRVGAVLVTSNRIISTGYNGTPSGLKNCNQGGCARCNNTLALPIPNQNGNSRVQHQDANGTSASASVVGTAAGAGGTSNGCGQNLEECLCLHAEENALLEAGRQKIFHHPHNPAASSGGGGGGGGVTTMYCNTCPCLRCAVKIIQCGIRNVVYQLDYNLDHRTKQIFHDAGVEIRQFHLE